MALGCASLRPVHTRAWLVWQRHNEFGGDFEPFWLNVSNRGAIGRGLPRPTTGSFKKVVE